MAIIIKDIAGGRAGKWNTRGVGIIKCGNLINFPQMAAQTFSGVNGKRWGQYNPDGIAIQIGALDAFEKDCAKHRQILRNGRSGRSESGDVSGRQSK